MKASDLYFSLPPFAQDWGVSSACLAINSRRYGGSYEAIQRDVLRRLDLGREKIEAFKDIRLRVFVEHAYQASPFWKRRIDSAGLLPSDIQRVADLDKLAVLDKHEVRS